MIESEKLFDVDSSIAIVFSVARSRFTIPAQFAFLAVNGFGLFTSIIYNAKTPDFYPGNAHHKMGWAVSWIATVWFLMTFLNLYMVRYQKTKERHAMTADNIAQYDRLQDQDQRWSRDSGRDSATLCSGSRSPSSDSEPLHKFEIPEEGDDQHVGFEEQGSIRNNSIDRFLSRKISRFFSGRALPAFKVVFTLIERCMPVLGFVSLISGGVVYGGLYVSNDDRLCLQDNADKYKSANVSSSLEWHTPSRAAYSSGTAF